ncbi:MAG TPA: SHOCT domain-containing protein [Alphaproteobacteria bacterium]|nr:SHOCT domain-containing protein [Alphaproteobacteria bacterium]
MRSEMGAALRCAVVLAALGLTACGSSSETTVTNRMVPPDQELRDLQRALQAGAISPAEYDQQRRKFLGR